MPVIYLFLLAIPLSFCLPSFSQAATPCEGAGKLPAVVHINGINTTYTEADENLKILKEATLSRSLPHPAYLAYNWSYSQYTPAWLGGMIDALGATIQGVFSVVQGGLKFSFSMVVKALFFWDAGIQDNANGTLQKAIDDMASAVMSFTDIKPGATASILADIASQIPAGSPLLLVPHSQGNLYANTIYSDLSATRQVKVVAVATPAPFTAGGGDYVNSRNDRVVTIVVPTARAWNVDIPKTTQDAMGHSFSDVYLSPALAVGRQAILDKIQTALSQLNPTTGASIPITLSWQDSSPLTLWVGDGGELKSALGINSTATYTVCEPQNFTFYFAWASTAGGWPAVATLSAGGKSTTVNLASVNDVLLWSDMVTRRLAGSVFINQAGEVIAVQ